VSSSQVFFVVLAFVILALITAAAQLAWLGRGRARTVLVAVAGVAVVLALRLADLPPSWFDGTKTGFGVALSLALGGFVTRGAEERGFGFPLLMSMGVGLLVVNLVELGRRVA
jgi:hypothetical protein